MSAFPDPIKARVLDYLFRASGSAPAGPCKLRLMKVRGSDSAVGTEIASTSGYVAPTVAFGAASAANGIANSGTVRVDGLPTGDVAGVEVWSSDSTPVRIGHAPLVDSGGNPVTRSFQAGDAVEFAAGEIVFLVAPEG